jgi:hypothetical protein
MDVKGDQPLPNPPPPQLEAAPDESFVIADDLPVHTEAPAEDELDGLRIARIAKVRRAAYRSRSHAIIGLVCCIVMIGQLVWVAVQNWGMGDYVFAAVSALMAIALIVLAVWCAKLALRLHRQATAPQAAIERGFEPEFSNFSDGSQRWKNLEKIE